MSRDHTLSKVKNPFLCELCKKSYARINDLDAHLVSYDHLHNERRRTLRQVHARVAPSSSQADGMLKVLPLSEAPAVKKQKTGGFKSAFGAAANSTPILQSRPQSPSPDATTGTMHTQDDSDKYDPYVPTMGWD